MEPNLPEHNIQGLCGSGHLQAKMLVRKTVLKNSGCLNTGVWVLWIKIHSHCDGSSFVPGNAVPGCCSHSCQGSCNANRGASQSALSVRCLMSVWVWCDINEQLLEASQPCSIVCLNSTDCALPVHAADNEGWTGFLHSALEVSGVLRVLPVQEAPAHTDPHQVPHRLWASCQHWDDPQKSWGWYWWQENQSLLINCSPFPQISKRKSRENTCWGIFFKV